jgi:DNA-binding NarL/FixJ family response regulator
MLTGTSRGTTLRPMGVQPDGGRGERGDRPLRVVIADDTYLVREALLHVLETADDIEVVGTARDRDSLLRTVEAEQPDVVVTDIRMPPTDSDEGIRVAAELRASHPQTGVVVLSQYAEPAYVLKLLENGSSRRAYLLKERVHHRGQLVDAVRAVHEGGSFIDPKVVELLARTRERSGDSRLTVLTPRERETLAEIAQGKSNEAIAESLVLTKRAVEKHINAIFMKLDLASAPDVSSRVKAALLFLAETDGPPPPGPAEPR